MSNEAIDQSAADYFAHSVLDGMKPGTFVSIGRETIWQFWHTPEQFKDWLKEKRPGFRVIIGNLGATIYHPKPEDLKYFDYAQS